MKVQNFELLVKSIGNIIGVGEDFTYEQFELLLWIAKGSFFSEGLDSKMNNLAMEAREAIEDFPFQNFLEPGVDKPKWSVD